jgi:hypothetical protein
MWDEGERKEREDSKEEHQKKLDDLERQTDKCNFC